MAYNYDRRTASKYKHWTREQRRRELSRLNEYAMDVDGDGGKLPPKIQDLLDLHRKLSEEEEDILIEWSESHTPGQYTS